MPAALTTCSVSIGPPSVQHGAHLAARAELDPGHARPQPDVDAERPRRVRHRVRRDVRVDVAVAGHPDAAEDRRAVGLRQPLEHLLGREQLGLEPDRRRRRSRPGAARAGCSSLDAMRTLPTSSKTPSSRYSSTL